MIDKSLFALPGIRPTMALLAVLCVVNALTTVGQAWSLSSAIVNVWYTQPIEDQTLYVVVFAACYLLKQVVLYVQDTRLDAYAFARTDELRSEFMETMFSQGPRLVSDYGTGTLTTLALEGTAQVENYLKLVLSKVLGVGIIPLVILIITFFFDWVSGIIMLVVYPFIIFYMQLLGKTAKAKADKQHKQFQRMSQHFIDSLRGLETLKLLGKSKEFGSKITETSERFRRSTMATLRVAFLSSTILDIFATFSLAAVAIMLGFRLVDDTIGFYAALLVLILVPDYFKPIREFASDYHASLDGKTSFETITSIIKNYGEGSHVLKGTTPTLPSTSAPANKQSASHIEPQAQQALRITAEQPAVATQEQPYLPHLVVSNVSFSYSDGYRSLSNISFEANGAQRIGIIGPSGSGKSTLIQVLGGFLAPQKGSFILDGETLPSLKCAPWQNHGMYIPQHPYLFNRSLKDNLAFYHPQASDAAIRQAIEIVGLTELVEELPDGLNTIIGESGRTFSGGQAQRIALGRALLDPKRSILLFDEPTAHLDIETEFELKERMLPIMENKLVLFATHRLHWLDSMDHVIVLDKGAIVAQGSPDEILQNDIIHLIDESYIRGGLS